MSQHASLRVDSVGTKHRNVLKRIERVKKMTGEGRWNDQTSIFKMPKLKSLKIKVKKGGGGRGPKEEEGKEAEKAKK